MNDDWYIDNIFWNYNNQRSAGMNTQQVYDMLRQLEMYSKKDIDMAYTYGRDNRYQDTRGDEVATATLEAYANGVSFETLIRKNATVRLYWQQVLADKQHKERQRLKEKERLAKLAEKRALEKAKKDEVLAKLTEEELEAFGLINKKVTKR